MSSAAEGHKRNHFCVSLPANMLKLLALLLTALLVTSLVSDWRTKATLPQQTPSRAPFALELPDVGGVSITEVETRIPTTDLRTLRLTIRNPFAESINYGQIYTAINGEAANTICGNIRSSRDGKVINCDLESKPRFAFQRGKNVVEISATDRNNNSYYASYVLIAGGSQLPAPGSSTKSQPVEVKFSGRKFAA